MQEPQEPIVTSRCQSYTTIKALQFRAGRMTDLTPPKSKRLSKPPNLDPLLLQMLERSSDMVVITEAVPKKPGPGIVYVNPAFTSISGYTADEVLGQSPRLLQGPDTDRKMLDDIRNALERHSPIRRTVLNYAKNGRPYWLDLSIFPLTDARGIVTHFGSLQRDVTAQETETKALAENHEAMAALMAALPDVVAVVDKDDRYTVMQIPPHMNHVYHAPPVIGRTEEEIVGPVAAASSRRMRAQAQATGKIVTRRHTFRGQDGSTRDVESRISPLADGACMFISRDVTDQVQAEEALRVSEQRFRDLVEGSILGVLIHRRTKVLFANDTWRAMVGLPPGAAADDLRDVGGKPLESPSWKAPHEDLLAGRIDVFRGTFKVSGLGDTMTWVSALARRVMWDGEPASQVTLVDITREVTAKQALARAEQRLRDAIEAIPDGFILFGPDRRLIITNQAYLDMLLPEGRKILKPGRHLEDITRDMAYAGVLKDLDTDEEKEAWIASVLERFETPGSTAEYVSNDGHHTLVKEQRTTDGCVVGIRTDVTAIKNNEAKLRAAKEQAERTAEMLRETAANLEEARARAEEASATKTRFLAHMSHELRTPMNAIIGFADAMKMGIHGPIGNAAYEEYVQHILDGGAHLLSLINDVLDMARLESGGITLHPAWLKTRVVLDAAFTLVPRNDNASTIDVLVDPEAAHVWADERALKQILVNLIGNAIRHAQSEKPITVWVSATAEGTTIVVRDHGVGISARNIEKRMEPFALAPGYVADSTRGTGLGLPLVHGLAAQHGGHFSIISSPGDGTTATVWLPISEDAGPRPATS